MPRSADRKLPADAQILIEDARLIFRNFSGKEGPFNREGDRNFCVILDRDVADDLAKDGWNIKELRARELDEGEVEEASPYIQVTVNFKGRPPRIVTVTSRGRTDIGEDEIEILDWADIIKTDLIIRPYEWQVNGKGGIKAYLKSLYVTIREDELEMKYSDVPSSRSHDD